MWAEQWLAADWAAPPGVHAGTTLRSGGRSQGAWRSFNLGDRCGDDAQAVRANRDRLLAGLGPRVAPVWIRQVHGVDVHRDDGRDDPVQADAVTTRRPGRACAVLTADCVPVLLCSRAGDEVAAVHAGWRGLCAGVLETAIDAMRTPAAELMAWIGPAIGPDAFEIGDDARQPLLGLVGAERAIRPSGTPGKWFADLPSLVRTTLAAAGLRSISACGRCTHAEPEAFFSYRRDGTTGRMASLIWIQPGDD